MSQNKTNYGAMIDPEFWYVVPYHIDQKGRHVDREDILQGKDLTEKQIIAMINHVDLDELINPFEK